MGSDWTWELQVPAAGEPALRELYALAAERQLRPQRPDGLINLFSKPEAHLRTVEDPEVALAAQVAGGEHGQLWADGAVDIYLSWDDGTLVWTLDSVFCHRSPVPEADTFRELHARLTNLWLAAAQRLDAHAGRILDEWSSEQVWQLRGPGRPPELGWWAYLGPGQHLTAPPPPEVTARSRRLPNGALLIELLDDPAAVDPLRYEEIHSRWLDDG
ncbi:hypothetical protein ACQP2Y_22825 [Actinoplanes sp. CA-051413]|uniref:hypothetical protein n=1 Tax=Actinoplanes sp. CA-051413 TaxID=3239899 RepID=UPI003D99BFA9